MAVSGGGTVARGREAERRVAAWYEARGAQVMRMNYAVRGGEIDLIVRDGDCVAFVEVKMRASAEFGRPAEAVTPLKRRRVCRAALMYAQAQGLLDECLRFDVAEVCGEQVNVYINAFDYEE